MDGSGLEGGGDSIWDVKIVEGFMVIRVGISLEFYGLVIVGVEGVER